jgi:uncharacterized protein YjiS (DUF1127 family)
MQSASRTQSIRASLSVSALALSMVSRFTKSRALARQRRALARLDDARLADLGLTRADVAKEIAQPVWDVPHNWRG